MHTVALKNKNFVAEKVEGPALLLQQELQWFEVIKLIIDEARLFLTLDFTFTLLW